MDKTIIYCTENLCPEPLATAARNHLKKNANCPIVSVSHKPIDFGKNICIGERRRSWTMLYRQLLIGCEATDTKYIGIAEHDCFYTEEHLDYIPPTDDKFYYNENLCLVGYDKEKHPNEVGVYSRFWKHPRLSLSQLVCNRKLYVDALEKRLALISVNRRAPKDLDHFTEPGHTKIRRKLIDRANSGSCAYLRSLLPDFIELEKYETFNTKYPNLDVRHGGNFTGPRRGKKRTYEVEPWGRFEDLIREN